MKTTLRIQYNHQRSLQLLNEEQALERPNAQERTGFEYSAPIAL